MSVSLESPTSESVHQDLLMQDQLRSANERLNVSYEHVFLEWKYTESHGGILLQIDSLDMVNQTHAVSRKFTEPCD